MEARSERCRWVADLGAWEFNPDGSALYLDNITDNTMTLIDLA